MIDRRRLKETLDNTRSVLRQARTPDGYWTGRLSSSPLATAVAVFALHRVNPDKHRETILNGLQWLTSHQQPDGSWGDAEQLDPGNLSTTLLCYAAFSAIDPKGGQAVIQNAQRWIKRQAGGMTAEHISSRLYQVYGKDRTFAVPILTMCAIAGVLGPDGWRVVKPLPFELAVLPRRLFRWLHLTVVSYALPALIAIGQVIFHFKGSSNPLALGLRKATRAASLRLLEKLQPANGGFLEATPLTSFVTLSLAAMGLTDHPVVRKGVEFITASVRCDGSWPIDTDLATWATSLSVAALDREDFTDDERLKLTQWYRAQQHRSLHVYTATQPGGWGWTHWPGAVPDADDTAGALVALSRLGVSDKSVHSAARQGLQWLMNLQNADGGVPTFCKGWGRLEFDRSCPDITAHAVQAWHNWKDVFDDAFQRRLGKSIDRAVNYLKRAQAEDGSWIPLWFGNPSSEAKNNPVYGTAKVLTVLAACQDRSECAAMMRRGAGFLRQAQNDDGGWGSQENVHSTIEETALAIEALCLLGQPADHEAMGRGIAFLMDKIEAGRRFEPSPVGLYFAKLWYAERLYPVIFTLKALRSADQMFFG